MHLLLDGSFLLTFDFCIQDETCITLSCVPLLIVNIGYCRCVPPNYAKLLKQNKFSV